MISVVIPIFNEEQSIPELHKRLVQTLSAFNVYEIIYIDDGSTDNSLETIKKIAQKDKTVRIFSFRINRGKSEGLTLGFQKAKGKYVVTLDADLQDLPEEIPSLYKKLEEGYDVVSGWRKYRQDRFFKIFSSRFFNFTVGFIWGMSLHDYNCGLKIYTADSAKSLKLYGGMHRFIPLLINKEGFRVTEIPVKHAERKFGKSKYGFSKLWKDLPDIFTMLFLTRYGKRPLHFFGTAGSIFVVIGIIIISYLEILHTFYKVQVGDRPLFFGGLLFVIAGLQITFTGFLADLIINIFHNPQLEENRFNLFLKYTTDKKEVNDIN